MMGCPEPVEVFGATYSKFRSYELDDHHTWSPPEVRGQAQIERASDVDDMATAIIRFANGATLHAEVSWSLNLETERENTELFGTRAGASLKPLKLFRDEYGRMVNLDVKLPERSGVSGHARAIRNFLDTIQGKAKPVVTPDDGIRIMTILDAIYESAARGRSVTIGELAVAKAV